MTTLAKARELAPIVERVHGPHHPEMARVRELTDAVGAETENDHQVFAELRELTNNYVPPADTCETVEALYGALKEADREFAS
ncbi:hypothetical protein [Flaviflexus massiliensis]|uniref:hypothetical protein n=1 Tax=Flaviflexus massiliensis TaxID=1522309 RepID=UPI0006D59DB5|nr:hypothetical protein [Flaviflexus massiliensis]